MSGSEERESADADADVGVKELLDAVVDSLGGTHRPGQLRMAESVESAIITGEHLLVQAGTGTGKSMAYLVPALRYATELDEPVVVATATLALQAQLVDRDLPVLAEAAEPLLGRRPRWATLKGRANYACLHRVRDGVPDDQGELVAADEVSTGSMGADVVRARDWAEEQARTGGTGDRDRLEPGVSDRAWAQVSVSARECLGASRCPYGQECFAEVARARAAEADVVVTNHALLAINALEGVPVLPEHGVVVVDEAHELVSRVTSVASADLWPAMVERAGTRSRAHAGEAESGELRAAGERLRDVLADVPAGRLDEPPEQLMSVLELVRDAARDVASGFSGTEREDRDPDVEAARRSAQTMVDDVHATAERLLARSEHDVAWVEEFDRGPGRPSAGRMLRVAPLSVAGLLREKLFDEFTVVGTSATLEIGGSFDSAAGSFGLLDEKAPSWEGVDVGSPFDYARQAILYVARDLPTPGRDGLRSEAVDVLAELISAAGGRTLGLFSSRRAAMEAGEAIRERLPDFPVLCQGDDVMATLVRRFAEDDTTSLFGTLSLWQGVDVPGAACHLVVIDRLPFPRPDEPLSSARQRWVERHGGNGFMTVAAHHAALLLAQGAGRLIRRSSDRGVVAVLDPRLVTARYGGYLRASLPPMWFTTDRSVVTGALGRLAGGRQAPGS
ncbi:ATP-dependent DNA helicase [Actinobacteria bacterium YIM 96077]|uniref:ATP-dependent helicase DinG n=1 Tax=Phytoactinopolyspora halophila TaxID=1981511 RepID=A0A329QVC0_9ACTN|nr:ATP-dependent DNA helicase [Phytoactinopolyspora halophila]AYY12827.1 ATP-dependent DNA helicase [Actinobacteria bacterium YIM 96077]RAW16380.1 ATP-dependent helicase [Phytoactinopolyspora halophila]